MNLVVEEAAVTIKVLSVGGRRMSKAVYGQLPQDSPRRRATRPTSHG
ncbi:hypothetical protein [Streptomyces sp. NPDC024089]